MAQKGQVIDRDFALIIIAYFWNSEKLQTLRLKNISELRVMKWDGYALKSIRIYCELKTPKDCKTISDFLAYHSTCLDRPWERAKDGK